MATATLDKSHSEWIGLDLFIAPDRLDLPDGCSLPAELWLKSTFVRDRGRLVGRRWYLQRPCLLNEGDVIDLVTPEDLDGSHDLCMAFLAHHGYRVKGSEELMEYVR